MFRVLIFMTLFLALSGGVHGQLVLSSPADIYSSSDGEDPSRLFIQVSYNDDWSGLSRFSRLEHLTILGDGNQPPETVVNWISSLSHLRSIKFIEVYIADMSFLSNIDGLTDIHLEISTIENVSSGQFFPNISSLTLAFSTYTNTANISIPSSVKDLAVDISTYKDPQVRAVIDIWMLGQLDVSSSRTLTVFGDM